MKRRTMVGLGFAVLVVGLAFAVPSWACTSLATLQAGPAVLDGQRSVVPLSGQNFERGPVEIRWGTSSGPILATPNGPNFSLPVTTPEDAAPGTYFILALSKDAKGTVLGKAVVPFEVGSANGIGSGALATGDPWSQSSNLSSSPASSASSRAFPLGVAMLSLGMVLLVASSLTVVSVRRAKQTAGSSRS